MSTYPKSTLSPAPINFKWNPCKPLWQNLVVEFVFSHQLCFEKGPNFRFQKEANAEPYIALFG